METINEQFFSPEFILNYTENDSGRKRFLTYIIFRFFSFAGKTNENLPVLLKERLGCSYTADDFSVVEDYLAADYYFSPSLAAGTFEPLFLYDAIYMVNHCEGNYTALDEIISSTAPLAAGLPYSDSETDFSKLLSNGMDFYAALCIAAVHYKENLPKLLPKFLTAYQEDFHFTCEDFILFDFMDEYFEQKNVILHPSFTELTDTLVAATLNYYDTDFGTLLENELLSCLNGSSSRFAGTKRFSCIQLPAVTDTDKACHLLAGLFRYAAIYELRNNLFDFHLEDDKLITLTNWKENLRWHYVQYSNVYEVAISSFYAAMLSNRLLKNQFAENISELS